MTKQEDAGPKMLNIYKLSRLIKREQNDLYNSLRSIYADSLFVAEISRLYPTLPLLANLRCGIWYSPRFDASCYFKSTDGHTGNWSFSLTRLNIHVAQSAAVHGGCIIIDATRRGKRYPDSLSKTVPIWCCVLNRALARLREEGTLNEELRRETRTYSKEERSEEDSSKDGGLGKNGLREEESEEKGLRDCRLGENKSRSGKKKDGGLRDGFEREGGAGKNGLRDGVLRDEGLRDGQEREGGVRTDGSRENGLREDGLRAGSRVDELRGGDLRDEALNDGGLKESGFGKDRLREGGFTSGGVKDNGSVRTKGCGAEGRDDVTADVTAAVSGRMACREKEGTCITDRTCVREAFFEHTTDGLSSAHKASRETEAGPRNHSDFEGARDGNQEPGRGPLGNETCCMRLEEGGRVTNEGADWRALHLPLWLSATERAAIENRVDGWVEQLLTTGADLHPLAKALQKPLRPLWISQRTVIWLNEVADVRTLPFKPVICLSASDPSTVPGHVSGNGSGWSYVAGAGDDEESWARGLSPALFWKNVHQILDSGPSGCKGAVARVVEEERVRAAMRSTGFGPGISVHKPSQNSAAKGVSKAELGRAKIGRVERPMDGDRFSSGPVVFAKENGNSVEESVGKRAGGLRTEERPSDGAERLRNGAQGSNGADAVLRGAEGRSDGAQRSSNNGERRSDGAERVSDGAEKLLTGAENVFVRQHEVSDGTTGALTVPDASMTDSSRAGPNESGLRLGEPSECSDCRDGFSINLDGLSIRAGVVSDAAGTLKGAETAFEKSDISVEPADEMRGLPEGECSPDTASGDPDAVAKDSGFRPSSGLVRKQPVDSQSCAEGLYPFDERGTPFGRLGAVADDFRESFRRWSFIGSTGMALGSASCCDDPGLWGAVDAVLDCCPEPHAGFAARKRQYAHLPIQGSKFDRRSLERHLSEAVRFARAHLGAGEKLLVVCKDGYDVSVCVCLAILLSSFESKGAYVGDRGAQHVSKAIVRQGLAFLSASYPEARPSRGNLKQVFQFVNHHGVSADLQQAGLVS